MCFMYNFFCKRFVNRKTALYDDQNYFKVPKRSSTKHTDTTLKTSTDQLLLDSAVVRLRGLARLVLQICH